MSSICTVSLDIYYRLCRTNKNIRKFISFDKLLILSVPMICVLKLKHVECGPWQSGSGCNLLVPQVVSFRMVLNFRGGKRAGWYGSWVEYESTLDGYIWTDQIWDGSSHTHKNWPNQKPIVFFLLFFLFFFKYQLPTFSIFLIYCQGIHTIIAWCKKVCLTPLLHVKSIP